MQMTDMAHAAYMVRDADRHESLKEWLCRPGSVLGSPLSEDEFSNKVREIRAALGPENPLFKLIALHIISGFLVFKENRDSWAEDWLKHNIPVPDYLSGLSLEQAGAGKWQAVPVILMGDQEPFLRYFITGLVPGITGPVQWPDWAGRIMAHPSREAVQNAADASLGLKPMPAKHGFYCCPLAVPNKEIQFKGRSLGLSLALGFSSLLDEAPLVQEILATGVIRSDGRVEKVGYLDQKIAGAEKQFKAFLYPSDNFQPQVKNLVRLPVENLDQAWMLTRIYTPGSAGQLSLFLDMLRDPRQFIRNIKAVPATWLEWVSCHGTARSVLENITASPVLFSALTDRLESAVTHSHNQTAQAISDLMSEEKYLTRIQETAPLSAFRWAGLNLCLCNHRGRISQAQSWSETAEYLLDRALAADLRAVTDFFNYRFVARHNRYEFRPELPDRLNRLLEVLERQYSHQCAFGCPVHLTLGAIYGSVCQNFGFCGPAFLPMTKTYAAKARAALGENTVPEYKHEWLRQHNYLTYALLDAGETESAQNTLFAYLDIDQWEQAWPILPDFSQWQHALTARFFADTGAGETYYQWAAEHPGKFLMKEHPWQIWHYNMGRMAIALGQRTEAAIWFRQSLGLCLSQDFGPTVRVMALLPLSRLLSLGLLCKKEITDAAEMIKTAAQKLSREHFRMLNQDGFETVLEKIGNAPERLFPFSYR
jgi:hypothetical protein